MSRQTYVSGKLNCLEQLQTEKSVLMSGFKKKKIQQQIQSNNYGKETRLQGKTQKHADGSCQTWRVKMLFFFTLDLILGWRACRRICPSVLALRQFRFRMLSIPY